MEPLYHSKVEYSPIPTLPDPFHAPPQIAGGYAAGIIAGLLALVGFIFTVMYCVCVCACCPLHRSHRARRRAIIRQRVVGVQHVWTTNTTVLQPPPGPAQLPSAIHSKANTGLHLQRTPINRSPAHRYIRDNNRILELLHLLILATNHIPILVNLPDPPVLVNHPNPPVLVNHPMPDNSHPRYWSTPLSRTTAIPSTGEPPYPRE